jgi:hypothetical protein
MATSQVSEHPLFTGLRDLIAFFPNPEDDHDFDTCRWQTKPNTRCRRWQKRVSIEAKALWLEIERAKECPDITVFYLTVERLLRVTYCRPAHVDKVLILFEEWKEKHCAYANLTDTPTETSSEAQELHMVLKEDSDEASQPETPEPEIFDSCFSDTSPFPTPLTEADSLRAPTKGPTSFLDSSIPDTPPGKVGQIPTPVAGNDKSIVNAITKDISTLSLNPAYSTSDRSSVNGKPATAESISEDDDVSFQETSDSIITPDRKPVADQTTSDVLVWQEKALEVKDDPLGQRIAIDGIGIGRLTRQGTLKKSSPILKALETPPTPKQREPGVVYVLQHTKKKQVFKIGWTKQSAIKRQNQAKNCYGINTEVIYESDTEFVGAYKAEQLAHKFLGNHKLLITSCESCGKGHTEWFEHDTKAAIVGTLKVMEDFVRMPAYELKAGQKEDGEMMLSQEAERRIKSMCNISIQGLQGPVSAQKEPAKVEKDSRESVEANSQAAMQTVVPQTTADVPIKSIEEEGSSNQPLAEAPEKREASTAATMGRWVGRSKKIFGKIKEKAQNTISREGTPEPDSYHESPKEKFKVALLWTLGGGRSEEALKEEKSPRGWSSLVQVMVDKKDKFKEEFTANVRKAEAAS